MTTPGGKSSIRCKLGFHVWGWQYMFQNHHPSLIDQVQVCRRRHCDIARNVYIAGLNVIEQGVRFHFTENDFERWYLCPSTATFLPGNSEVE